MLQYLVDDYLGGYGLPRLRKVAGRLRLDLNEKEDRCLIMLDNKPIKSLTEVVAVRLCCCPIVGLRMYLLFPDMTECWMCYRQHRERVSHDTLQLYLKSSE
jgi:hypothetical protein